MRLSEQDDRKAIELLPQVDRILGRMESLGISEDQKIGILDGIDPPWDEAVDWFRALAIRAGEKGYGPNFHRWLQGKLGRNAPASTPAPPPASAALPDWDAAPGSPPRGSEDGWSRAEASYRQGRWEESLELLLPFLEGPDHDPGRAAPGPSSGWLPELAEKACLAGRASALARLRQGLRRALHARLTGSAATGSFNLLVLEAAQDDVQRAFEGMLDSAGFRFQEALAAAPLRILWIQGGSAWYIGGDGIRKVTLSEGWRETAGQAAHCRWDGEASAWHAWGPAGRPGDEYFDPADAEAREAAAIASFDLLPRLLELGIRFPGAEHPGLAGLAQGIRRGAEAYGRTGATPPESYQNLISLYGVTRGYSNDFLSFLLRLYRPCRPAPTEVGILGRLDEAGIRAVVADIRLQGYHVFDRKLGGPACDLLAGIARATEARLNPGRPGLPARAVYDPDRPLAEQYLMLEEELLHQGAIQGLVADPSLLAVSAAYLGSVPILDMITMWWSTTLSREARTEVAQLYHFDMDRIKWLKWFVYLTDVDTHGGPHCYVAGSNRRGAKPEALLRHGYARISDEEVASQFPPGDMREIHGRRGTIIAVDTRGFHKGKLPTGSTRLVFELEFANSLFGAECRREARVGNSPHPALSAMARRLPEAYRKYL